MTPADLEAIEARQAAVPHWHSNGPVGCWADIAALLAAVKAYRALLVEAVNRLDDIEGMHENHWGCEECGREAQLLADMKAALANQEAPASE
jgi:hypothetical protein